MSGWNVYRRRYENGHLSKDSISTIVMQIKDKYGNDISFDDKTLGIDTETWWYPEYNEFLNNIDNAKRYRLEFRNGNIRVTLDEDLDFLLLTISSPSKENIEFSRLLIHNMVINKVFKKEKTIFIGHGKSNQWRDLKDHLADIHHYKIECYEIGPRAGMSVKEVLEKMLNKSAFALLVLTGEDEFTDGSIHARENVIHEVGLFQGKLGFENAIVLLEDGVKEFSNILGINQIRFSKNKIRESFGDVLGILKEKMDK